MPSCTSSWTALHATFAQLASESAADACVAAYRSRYLTHAFAETSVFEGIDAALDALDEELIVVTSKPVSSSPAAARGRRPARALRRGLRSLAVRARRGRGRARRDACGALGAAEVENEEHALILKKGAVGAK